MTSTKARARLLALCCAAAAHTAATTTELEDESTLLADWAAAIPALAQSWNRTGCGTGHAATARLGCLACDVGWDDTQLGWRGVRCNRPGGRVTSINAAEMGVQPLELRGDVSSWSNCSKLDKMYPPASLLPPMLCIVCAGGLLHIRWRPLIPPCACQHVAVAISRNLGGTRVSGDVSSWRRLRLLRLVNLQYTKVSGNVSQWSALTVAQTIQLGRTVVSGDISGWRQAMPLARLVDLYGTRVTGWSGLASWGALSAEKWRFLRNTSAAPPPDTVGRRKQRQQRAAVHAALLVQRNVTQVGGGRRRMMSHSEEADAAAAESGPAGARREL
jgi:hypothetical protein